MYKDFWDGHSITLDKQGILTLLVSTDLLSIKLRLGLLIVQKAKASAKSLTIHFSKQDLENSSMASKQCTRRPGRSC